MCGRHVEGCFPGTIKVRDMVRGLKEGERERKKNPSL